MVADKFLSIKLEPYGYILNDTLVVKAVKMQQPFTISFPKCNASKNIREISRNLVEAGLIEIKDRSGLKGFIHRLVGYMNT
jgi:flagellar biosynthesis protein FlhG